MPPPVVAIVGRSRSGKTTLIRKLIPELAGRGYRVATIKHAPKKLTLDEKMKDSRRHLEAGSLVTVVSGKDRLILEKPTPKEASLEEAVDLLGEDYDIILVEGFKQAGAAVIEVHRKEVGSIMEGLKKRLAIVTDEPLDIRLRQYDINDIKGVADIIEQGFIKPNKERVTLCVNGEPLALTAFPRRLVTGTVLAMVSSLKGVDEIKSLRISLEQPDKE